MADDKQAKNDPTIEKIKDPAAALLKILHGDTENLNIPHKSIMTGKKLKNEILTKVVKKYLELKTIPPEKIIEIILLLDEMVEHEQLTEDVFDAIRKDPSILNNINK